MRLPHRRADLQESRVRGIAERLGIPLRVVDLERAFEQEVLNHFSSAYFSGKTPNPCMVCNRTIKFGLLQEAILAAGHDKMATGHYARLVSDGPRPRLFQGVDQGKDQSYFLSRLSHQQLAKTLFPLGEQHKDDTYRLVEEQGFSDFRGLESQDVCFLENREIGGFLEARAGERDFSGAIVDSSGRRLGRHRGFFRYTIGQRRGLGIAAAEPLYVIALDAASNTVVVGSNQELFADRMAVSDWHWLTGTAPQGDRPFTVRIRSTHLGSPARLLLAGDKGEIRFQEQQRAITPGQFAVIYDGAELLGSAIIDGALGWQ